jgi:hypothetical protein
LPARPARSTRAPLPMRSCCARLLVVAPWPLCATCAPSSPRASTTSLRPPQNRGSPPQICRPPSRRPRRPHRPRCHCPQKHLPTANLRQPQPKMPKYSHFPPLSSPRGWTARTYPRRHRRRRRRRPARRHRPPRRRRRPFGRWARRARRRLRCGLIPPR